MTRDELLALLRRLQEPGDPEGQHGQADDALLKFIGDPEITEAFEAIKKWYA